MKKFIATYTVWPEDNDYRPDQYIRRDRIECMPIEAGPKVGFEEVCGKKFVHIIYAAPNGEGGKTYITYEDYQEILKDAECEKGLKKCNI